MVDPSNCGIPRCGQMFPAIGNQKFLGKREDLVLDLKCDISVMNLVGVFFDSGISEGATLERLPCPEEDPLGFSSE